MSRFDPIADLLNKDRNGHTLPRELYVSEEAFRFDTQVMLKSVWLYACTVAHVKNPGDYFAFEIANNSIIIVRGRDNEVRAFWNSCRHRGAKICLEQKGRAPRLMCPYHQWTYGLDGKLIAARSMAGIRKPLLRQLMPGWSTASPVRRTMAGQGLLFIFRAFRVPTLAGISLPSVPMSILLELASVCWLSPCCAGRTPMLYPIWDRKWTAALQNICA